MIRIAKCVLASAGPYSQSRYVAEKRGDKETPNDFEGRTWRERMHVNEKGNVIIPGMAFKNCLSEAAKFLGRQIPGKGKQTFTKHFEAGVMVPKPSDLGIEAATVPGEELFVPADGRRGSGKRVMKTFPVIVKWKAEVEFIVFDDLLTEEVFEDHLREAGQFIGIGRFRPRNNGYYGRFDIVSIQWGTKT
jgi:hypothetical protein